MFHWYGLIVGIAVITGWSIAEKIESKVGKNALWIILGALIGARLYHVIDLSEYYLQDISRIMLVQDGGLGIFGGIIGGAVTAVFLKVGWRELGAIATALPLSQAIGRLGNAANGEFGEKVWGLPWWSVEAVFNLILFGIMWRLYLRGTTSQRRVGIYLIGYGVIRFVLEFWRQNYWMIASLGVAQWVSLTSVVVGWLVWRSSAQD